MCIFEHRSISPNESIIIALRIQMNDSTKLIEQFLERNNLQETLKVFKSEAKRLQFGPKVSPALANIHKLSIPSDS